MMTKTILDKETIPRVELDFMNNTHFEEIEMVKELGEIISSIQDEQNGNQLNNLSQKLNAWLDHTKAHFARENELMQETGFPAYSIHLNEHEVALKQMTSIIKAWQDNQDIDCVEDYVFNLWPEWFEGHVNTMDMITAKFAVMNGYTND